MPQVAALGIAGLWFAAAVACSAASWRALLGAPLSFGNACARYGLGSLANTFLPGRAGDAIRIGLFGRVVPGGALPVVGAVAAVGAVRWLALLLLGLAGVVSSRLPPLALAGVGIAFVPLPAVWLFARRGSRRARAVLAPLRRADRGVYAAALSWILATLGARIAAVVTVSSGLGVSHPLAGALLVVPALELAGLVPLTPANVGVAGAAAAIAFHAQGMPMHAALAAGLVLHAVETCTGMAFGAAGALTLARTMSWRQMLALRPAVAELTPH